MKPETSTSAPLQRTEIEVLERLLRDKPQLDFSVLIGSRAKGTANRESDWDIALQWAPDRDWMTVLAETETLRHELAQVLHTDASAIDLIDLRRANLAMRASVAEEGLSLSGEDSLSWVRFLRRTWRDLEDFYWERQHAA